MMPRRKQQSRTREPQKMSHVSVYLWRLLILGVSIGVWAILAQYDSTRSIVSSPSVVFDEFRMLFTESPTIWSDMRFTLEAMLRGLLIAGVLGTLAGVVIGGTGWLRTAFNPLMTVAYGFPHMSLTPLIVMWFGLGMNSKIALVAMTTVFVFFFSVYEVIGDVPAQMRHAMRLMGVKRFALAKKLMAPIAVGGVLRALQNAVGLGFLAAIFGEYVASTQGLGYRAASAGHQFAVGKVWALVIVIGLVGWAVSTLGTLIQRKVGPWLTA